MAKIINLYPEFSTSIHGYENGETLDEVVLNRPLVQVAENTIWLKSLLDSVATELSDSKLTYTDLDDVYERKFIKRSGFNLELATAEEVNSSSQPTNKVAPARHNHDDRYEPVITVKGTAFNKNFGTSKGTVVEGNDPRLSDPRSPTAHRHDLTQLNANGASVNDILMYDGTRWVPASQDVLSLRIDWGSLDNTPDTLSGYGITNAYSKTEIDELVESILTQFPTQIDGGSISGSSVTSNVSDNVSALTPYDVSDGVVGQVTNTVLKYGLAPRDYQYLEGGAKLLTPSTTQLIIGINKNGAEVASLVFAPNQTVATQTGSWPVTIAKGDLTSISISGSTDARDLAFFLTGVC